MSGTEAAVIIIVIVLVVAGILSFIESLDHPDNCLCEDCFFERNDPDNV